MRRRENPWAKKSAKLDSVKSYKELVRALKRKNSPEEAMQLAVGGNFDAIGALERELLFHCGLKQTDYLIDVGCGSGRLAKPLSEYFAGKYLGIDVVPDLIEYARSLVARPDWRFELTEGLCIPEDDGKADMICFFSVFTHLLHEFSYIYLDEARRVLKPGGKIVFSFLEFAMRSHWGIFESHIKNIGGLDQLNMFIGRDAIRAWAERLDLQIEMILDGDKPNIPVSHPVVPANGNSAQARLSFGQSVCVLTKR